MNVGTTRPKSGRSAMNAKRLLELHPKLRAKVAAVVRDLEGHGWQPLIACGYRSPEEQKRAYLAGRSRVLYSFHNARNGDAAAALAADIVDARRMWGAPREFWEDLGRSAVAHGLVWGGSWERFPDVAHVQLLTNSLLGAMKEGFRP